MNSLAPFFVFSFLTNSEPAHRGKDRQDSFFFFGQRQESAEDRPEHDLPPMFTKDDVNCELLHISEMEFLHSYGKKKKTSSCCSIMIKFNRKKVNWSQGMTINNVTFTALLDA